MKWLNFQSEPTFLVFLISQGIEIVIIHIHYAKFSLFFQIEVEPFGFQ